MEEQRKFPWEMWKKYLDRKSDFDAFFCAKLCMFFLVFEEGGTWVKPVFPLWKEPIFFLAHPGTLRLLTFRIKYPILARNMSANEFMKALEELKQIAKF